MLSGPALFDNRRVCVQQQDRAVGGRVPVLAGLARTRLPLGLRRAAPRPPAARASVARGCGATGQRVRLSSGRVRVQVPPPPSRSRVEELGRPRRPHKPQIVGSNPTPAMCANVAQRRRHRFRKPAPQGRRGFESHRWLCDRSSRGEHEAVNLGTRVRFPPVTPSCPERGAVGSPPGSHPRRSQVRSLPLRSLRAVAQPVAHVVRGHGAAGSNPACSIQSG